ncbi:AcrR family transcriptional regulator [Okibacterium sp. HSC-33S16]|uniref:TetR/AcrR family transcriptional regulator n=1 Tax=Okibacterium sp. HSC-33S16 TaxID=2910965 RepID=UPI00209C99C7|nr:TetR/AcrR family transcriptional regulator [Okibacterium sp. HSC-33S16]MCP2030495.1 AcrR family transcriptional regulator [Okibacterium sp. HSC-33S16]
MTSNHEHGDERMPRAASTQERILIAYEDLLLELGERGATLEAVASRAGVSKGGLLYHFGSKEALSSGLVERLHRLTDEDLVLMMAAPAGPVDYLIRTSIDASSPLDRALIATSRLAQAADARAGEALASIRSQWLAVITEAVGDPATARAIVLVSDGLYFNSAMRGMGTPDPADVSAEGIDSLLTVLDRFSTPSVD